jgi:tRNA(fMet)-specific endonuclease VapC
MRYLLDTNIVSNLVRHPQGRVSDRLKAVGEQNICTSIIVAAELRYGMTKKASPRLTAQVEAVLGVIDTLPFESPADEIYGSIRSQLELVGKTIGGNDLLIAAQALALDHILVSDNDQEFSRVEGLRVENWLRD